MDNPLLVCGLERLRDLSRDRERFALREARCAGARRPLRCCQSFSEGLAFDQLQDQTAHAVCLFDAVDGADVRVVQRREHPRLTLEARAPFRIRRERRRQDLDRDLASKRLVVRPVDLAHPTNAEQ